MYDTALFFLKVCWVLSDVDASALAAAFGFDYKGFDESSFARLDEVVSNFGVVIGV